MHVSSNISLSQSCYISEGPEEVEQVPWAVRIQDQIHGQAFGLTVQHPDHVLMFTHFGLEVDPIHKLLSFRLVGTIYIMGLQS